MRRIAHDANRATFVSATRCAWCLSSLRTPAVSNRDTAPQTRSIHAGRLIDGVSTAVRERVSISIAGDRITDVEDGFVSPAGAQVIDLSRAR